MTPLRARCIWDMLREPLALAWSASRFSIQLSRSGINPPKRYDARCRFSSSDDPPPVKEKYGIGWLKRQLAGRAIRDHWLVTGVLCVVAQCPSSAAQRCAVL